MDRPKALADRTVPSKNQGRIMANQRKSGNPLGELTQGRSDATKSLDVVDSVVGGELRQRGESVFSTKVASAR